MNTSYTYKHRDIDQTVHDTYQYWKYAGSENPVKTPSEGYMNGLAGIGVTLESVVKDEPWDIMVFQPHVIVKAHMPEYCGFDINDLISRMKSMMDSAVAEGIPMYIASLCYAYVLLGLTPDEISFYPKFSKDVHLTGDRGETIQTKTENTPDIAGYARKHVYRTLGLE